MTSQYERDAMLGRLARLAADVPDDRLSMLCDAAEVWGSEGDSEEPEPVRLVFDAARIEGNESVTDNLRSGFEPASV